MSEIIAVKDFETIIAERIEKLNIKLSKPDKFLERLRTSSKEVYFEKLSEVDSGAFDECIRKSPTAASNSNQICFIDHIIELNSDRKGKGRIDAAPKVSEQKRKSSMKWSLAPSSIWVNNMKVHGKIVKDDHNKLNPVMETSSVANVQATLVSTKSKSNNFLIESDSNLSLFNDDDIPLPSYECTVQKEGYLKRLYEIEDFISTSKKNLKRTYFILWGTILKEYEHNPTPEDVPLKVISLQFSSITMTKDSQSKAILRLSTPSTRIMFQFDNAGEAQKWNDYIEMSIAISSSLETRELMKKPKISRRQRQ